MIFDYQGINGFDISTHNDSPLIDGHTNFVLMKKFAEFVVIRAGNGLTKDADFDIHWKNAKLAGMPRSSYWFCNSFYDPIAQARAYYNIIKDDIGEGMVFADYETGCFTDWNNLYIFITELQRLTKLPDHRIGIYTGYYYWRDHSPTSLASKLWFRKYPLWIAWYGHDSNAVLIPDTWLEALIWQKGTPTIGHDVGVESFEIDDDQFNGGREKFAKHFLNGMITVPPYEEPLPEPEPPQGGDMLYKLRVDATALNGRNTPDSTIMTNINFTGGFKKNDILLSNDKFFSSGMFWYKITSCTRMINGVSTAIQIPTIVWAGAGATGGYLFILEEIPTEPDEEEVPTEVYFSFAPNGKKYKYILEQ